MKCAPLALACGLAAFASAAGAQTLYSNGAFVTHPGAHVSGEDVSLAQDVTYPGYSSLGITAGPEWRRPTTSWCRTARSGRSTRSPCSPTRPAPQPPSPTPA